MKAFSSFFASSLDAHEMMFIMRLSALNDESNKGERNSVSTLYHLVVNEQLTGHPSSKVSLIEIRNRLSALRKQTAPLQKIRNHYYAHRLSFKLEERRANELTYDGINQILVGTENVFNDLSVYIDGTVYLHQHQAEQHTEELLERLHSTFQ